ncbi:hypothetical protein LR48_Vigan10g068800 [Vigna angularis]|uniref:Uncharacterized protein n=1 Tax=Phaseolus angularis TaxID=3914 RepID=A0A0L9VIB3_PHAAN|nr:hypothetical protein LR48_Vigan10g068800 [Vigna angularis]
MASSSPFCSQLIDMLTPKKFFNRIVMTTLNPFCRHNTPTEASKNEYAAEKINFGEELETEIDNIIDATELQPENTGTATDSAPRVST